VTDTYDFDAFGNLINSTGTTPNNYLFAGEQFDPDLGLYYNRARYLDVRAGRFWGMDTEEGQDQDPLSLHKYLYADADPVDGVDPTGHDDMSDTLDALTMTIMSTAIIGPAACAGCGAQVPTDSDAALLARLVFAEAIPTQTGTLAVASVAVNRMHSNSHGFPGSISGVIYQSGQFEATFQPKPGQKQNMKWLKAATQAGIHGLNPNDCLTYQLAVSAAQNAMSGNTNTDAVLYYDDRISEPKWVNDLLLPADVIGGDSPSNYIDYPAGNGQYFFKYAPPKPKPHRPGRN
jgi:RHS repeat-associated protein